MKNGPPTPSLRVVAAPSRGRFSSWGGPATKKVLIAGAALALMGALVAPAHAQINAQVQVYPGTVYVAPPPPRYEPVPVPRHGYAWVPGYWQPYGGRHNWVPGHWVAQPGYVQPGYVYTEPNWRERERWERRHNYGRRDFDRDGVPNRYDRDVDGDGVPNRYDRRPNNPYRY